MFLSHRETDTKEIDLLIYAVEQGVYHTGYRFTSEESTNRPRKREEARQRIGEHEIYIKEKCCGKED